VPDTFLSPSIMYIVFVSQTLQENLCRKYPLAFSVLNRMNLKSVCK